MRRSSAVPAALAVLFSLAALGAATAGDDGVAQLPLLDLELLGQGDGPGQLAPRRPPAATPTPTMRPFVVTRAAPEPCNPHPGAPRFDPALDAPAELCFHSVLAADGGRVDQAAAGAGTCLGFALFAPSWYQRVVRPVQEGRESQFIRVQRLEVGVGEAYNDDLSGVGRNEADGVNYLTMAVMEEARARGRGAVLAPATVAANLDRYRLRALSTAKDWGRVPEAVNRAVIAHHGGQVVPPHRWVSLGSPDDVAAAVYEIRTSLNRFGVQTFFVLKRRIVDGRPTDEAVGGHAAVIYACTKVRVKLEGDAVEHKALRLDFWDSNIDYALPSAELPAEGRGTYLLYLYETRQLALCQWLSGLLKLQERSEVLTDEEALFGLVDHDPSHEDWDRSRRQALLDGHVGKGRRLTAVDMAILKDGGTVRLPVE